MCEVPYVNSIPGFKQMPNITWPNLAVCFFDIKILIEGV